MCMMFSVDHPAVAVELKLARPIAYPSTRTLSVASILLLTKLVLNCSRQENDFHFLSGRKSDGQSGTRATNRHNHKALKAMRLTLLGHLDTFVSDNDNMWYCFYHNVSQPMGFRYFAVLKQKLVLTSNSIQPYHTMN